ncbi:MAG: hypothetical protein AYP45_13905 [Candidatus Brocadia carolinensis]|uniref:Uncharacterized protein n=1 Tax=Candidatus Brocadia carolinensis TaxID=1004156 RepID=A0A1V4AR65_9BACT|nr:MAG: hypothetical protein AYP45_13905 [Candidatus Brocadia caroliniensis]
MLKHTVGSWKGFMIFELSSVQNIGISGIVLASRISYYISLSQTCWKKQNPCLPDRLAKHEIRELTLSGFLTLTGLIIFAKTCPCMF